MCLVLQKRKDSMAPHNDAMYGSQYRPQAPISKRIKVDEGEKKPSRTSQKATYVMTGLHSIKRGDSSNTAWVRNKKNQTQSFGDVVSLDDSPEME